ncbi:hypothetical protein FRACA_940002 [Frankia canadensis]|uniref:Uncharacterized protein n=1 Tax=Frankia canadensis TaxID=1836972 RepID=A0A2I2L2M3_9ACTN|nr:hypothetical protein FRACA_940002 [Frankia canadensis]SOU59451.1 hypothetical protein FRACA_940002 [Frankia canadensis]
MLACNDAVRRVPGDPTTPTFPFLRPSGDAPRRRIGDMGMLAVVDERRRRHGPMMRHGRPG